MGDRQDVVLAVRVHHRERHLVVVVLAVHRLVGEVLQRVVHPAHVPLQPETEPAAVGGLRHPAPSRRLLGDRHHAGGAPVHGRVHLLEERHGRQVLPAAVGVGLPLAVLARVVQVEHGRHRVHAQPVDVELLAPVHRVRHEEVAHLGAGEVELVGAPVRVLGAPRVPGLVQRVPVEPGQCPVVLREVRRHPVHDHADARPVAGVDEVPEVVRAAEPRGRRVEAGDLVAPGAVEGVLGDRHQLDVGEPEVLDVRREFLGELPVAQPRPPGRQMHLVHRERRLVHRPVRAVRHPLSVTPLVVRGRHDRRRVGRLLGAARHRVRLQEAVAVPGGDLELVGRALADAGQEQLPHAGRAERPHRELRPVPVGEVRRDPHALRVRRPHREPGARHALVGHRLRTERLPQLLVPALADQVQVELAERGQETVRVVHLLLAALVRHVQRVGGDLRQRQHAGEQAVALRDERGALAAGHHAHRAGEGAQRPEHDPARDRVCAQQGVRIVVGARQQASAVLRAQGGRGRARDRAGRLRD